MGTAPLDTREDSCEPRVQWETGRNVRRGGQAWWDACWPARGEVGRRTPVHGLEPALGPQSRAAGGGRGGKTISLSGLRDKVGNTCTLEGVPTGGRRPRGASRQPHHVPHGPCASRADTEQLSWAPDLSWPGTVTQATHQNGRKLTETRMATK